jgi:branched-subunit amino acid transport protein
MSSAQIWVVILGGMLVTYGTRLSFFFVRRQESLPAFFRRGLRLVAPAVLAAIIAPQVLIPPGADAPVLSPRLLAATLAAVIGWRTRNAWLAIGSGMVSLWLLQALLGP